MSKKCEMKSKVYTCVLIIITILYFIWLFIYNGENISITNKSIQPNSITSLQKFDLPSENITFFKGNCLKEGNCNCLKCITLAVSCCGDRDVDTLVLLKSVIALTRRELIFYIFTELSHFMTFEDFKSSLPINIKNRVQIHIKEAKYPSGTDEKSWRNLFKPCASIRLFLPYLLPEIDSLLYLDTDVVLLAPVERIWDHFLSMNSSQMAAVSPEHEDPAVGWYNRFAKHPYYGKLGINSGVMLMNFTRLRTFGWIEYLSPILKEFGKSMRWGDQDIINIIFHYHPDKLYIYGCEHNYRSEHCMYMSVCKSAEKNGIVALHGSRGIFHNNKQPAFLAIYIVWLKYNLGEDLRQNLYYPMQKVLLQTSKKSNCAKIPELFLKNLQGLVAL